MLKFAMPVKLSGWVVMQSIGMNPMRIDVFLCCLWCISSPSGYSFNLTILSFLADALCLKRSYLCLAVSSCLRFWAHARSYLQDVKMRRHMVGNLRKSFQRNVTVHHSWNRGTAIHGVHYLSLENNFIFRIMGHAFFIEDGVEEQNTLKGNLCVLTIASNSLLNTDQTPACFW
jgi:hypothetical protein